jgi:hypothetical protein
VLGVPHRPTFILVGVPLRALLKGTNNGECLKMAVGPQEFSTSFTRTINHVTEDELGKDLLLQVMTTTLEEELAPHAWTMFLTTSVWQKKRQGPGARGQA